MGAAKYDSAGNLLWFSIFDNYVPRIGDSRERDFSYAIDVDLGGNVYITGATGGAKGQVCATVRFGSGGNFIWGTTYPYRGRGASAAVDERNCYVAAGPWTLSSPDPPPVIQYDTNG